MQKKSREGPALIRLDGSFALVAPDGDDATPRGKRSQAILGMLAVTPGNRRARKWLQDKLWSDRDEAHGAASLRQELSALRRQLDHFCPDLMYSDRHSVWLDPTQFQLVPTPVGRADEFLEGLDVRDQEFEDWLRSERQYRAQLATSEDCRAPKAVLQSKRGAATVQFNGLHATGNDSACDALASGISEDLRVLLKAVSGMIRLTEGDAVKSAYQLSGTIRRADRYKASVRLVGLASGEVVWSDRFECSAEATFEEQEKIAREIVAGLQAVLTEGQWSRHWAEKTGSSAAWAAFQKGRAKEAATTRTAHAAARTFLREAITADPAFLSPKITLAFLLLDEVRLEWVDDVEKSVSEARELWKNIAQIDPRNEHGRALGAFLHVMDQDLDSALREISAAVKAYPESPEMRAYQALIIGMRGDYRGAIKTYRHALSLVPHPESWIWSNLGLDLLAVEDNPSAEEAFAEALTSNPRNLRAHIGMVVASVRRGDMAAARSWAARVCDLDPEFRAGSWRAARFYRERQPIDRIARELSIGGL